MVDERPVTKLNVSTTKDEEEILAANGYQLINSDLSEGTGKKQVYLWYKKEHGLKPVTRIQFSFTDKMKSGLADAGYELVDRDLNAGAGGDFIFLWYFYGSTESDIPIMNLKVSKDAKEEPALLKDGWERLGCDLNRRAGGKFIYLWVKREKPSYICEIKATVDFSCDRYMFEQGYTRVDEDTNRGARGKYVFLWYRRSTDKSKALTALNISTSPQEQTKLQTEGFEMVVSDLSIGAGGAYVYAWYRKERCESQIQAMVLLINPDAWKEYQKAGISVVEKNLNEGNKGWKMYIAYK
ncbi:uncharacterized protein LOC109070394 [Cyprinus carpio]|uniref:Uncharacterized protein LOC109070394 n=1 Tax=Cyprinus carpio TaxID=7962 RepID=A0A9Q9V613_CYPCA|nr:uncharacterized protein LOC109070394 [Cyprinus carpio]XP_018942505.1 uncharacterized protein LOC109070394 [Cyprinus carpio]